MTDQFLQQQIIDELDFDPQVNPAHIGIIVDHGVVTLAGHVTDYAEKLAAEAAVRRVKGVRAVADELQVRVPNHKRTADDEIATRVADIFEWDSRIPRDDIRITVQNGWVYLDGEVAWNFQRTEAQAQVAKLTGVVGLANNITVRPRPPLREIREHIQNAFQRSAAIDADAIAISVQDDGKVRLDGTIRSWPERDAAETAVWSVPGVTKLESNLRIV